MKKVFVLALAIIVSIGYFNMPQMISSAIPSVYYITPNQKTYENVVNCQGTVQSAEVREVYLRSAVVPETICVDIGDEVSEGDLLAVIDETMTESLNASAADLLRDFSASGNGLNQNNGVDWLSLASQYGLSAVLSGGNIDYVKLNDAVQGTGSSVVSQARTGVVADVGADITSPVSGTVTGVNLVANAPASSGMAAFTIANMQDLRVMASVSEGDISKINVGDLATVRGVGFGGRQYGGYVLKIYPTARKSLTSTDTVVDVEIALYSPDSMLKPGFSAKVEIMGDNDYELLTVPYEAIRQDENNDEYVYIYENGKLKKQIIVTGQELTSEVEILAGLSFDSVIVYNPGGMVKEGSMISIKGRADA